MRIYMKTFVFSIYILLKYCTSHPNRYGCISGGSFTAYTSENILKIIMRAEKHGTWLKYA